MVWLSQKTISRYCPFKSRLALQVDQLQHADLHANRLGLSQIGLCRYCTYLFLCSGLLQFYSPWKRTKCLMRLKRPRHFCTNVFHVWGGERKFKSPCLKERNKICFGFIFLRKPTGRNNDHFDWFELKKYLFWISICMGTVLSTATVQNITESL